MPGLESRLSCPFGWPARNGSLIFSKPLKSDQTNLHDVDAIICPGVVVDHENSGLVAPPVPPALVVVPKLAVVLKIVRSVFVRCFRISLLAPSVTGSNSCNNVTVIVIIMLFLLSY